MLQYSEHTSLHIRQGEEVPEPECGRFDPHLFEEVGPHPVEGAAQICASVGPDYCRCKYFNDYYPLSVLLMNL